MNPQVAKVEVGECLEEAGRLLQSAIDRLENGEEEVVLAATNEAPPPPADTTTTSNDDYPDDDFAAAFFAQQARKKQEENRLPVQEWAQTILGHASQLQAKKEGTAAASLIAAPHSEDEDLMMGLFEEFQSALLEDGSMEE